jgi:hypothetical protein
MQAKIQPVTFFKDTATIFRVNTVQVREFGDKGSAIVLCTLMTDDDRILSNQTVMISGDNYAAWGSDDEYILSYALNSLGLTRDDQA